MIRHAELTEELGELRKGYDENNTYLRSLLQANIEDYNNLAEFVPTYIQDSTLIKSWNGL